MTKDLVAALREAREFVEGVAETTVEEWRKLNPKAVAGTARITLAHIDAALSAASGEASGDDKAHIDIEAMLERNRRMEAASRPAPSEAPNVERARELSNSWVRAWTGEALLDKREGCRRAILSAIDAARAEGIAAERERCTKIANGFAAIDNRHEEIALRIRDAIREAKP